MFLFKAPNPEIAYPSEHRRIVEPSDGEAVPVPEQRTGLLLGVTVQEVLDDLHEEHGLHSYSESADWDTQTLT